MNETQRSAAQLGRRARDQAWSLTWTLFTFALVLATGLASWAYFMFQG